MTEQVTPEERTWWRVDTFRGPDEPLLLALIKYRKSARYRTLSTRANLVSSLSDDGKQYPIIDLDIPHHIRPSSREGHSHLYLDVPVSKPRWVALMWGLYMAGVIDKGFFWWSLRRGQNFARINSTKSEEELTFRSTYGWLFRKRKYHHGRV